ncbi:SPOR domain-containing protein [Chelativorans sp. AA-79]|uniref:SPOR domain-containing protein n=1 Tax=Chelativorans sp. AA-79 TaxID=3028735 RepID=UPI0023FA3BDF|nr:SPOR domain-containing protein [Chelativorans sp. AA-79]WEX07332.1 SPOR domain-containing protein [Chelativorans sp. AA-79]
MADSTFKTSADANDLPQDDPFAELTRIMGHDPRTVTPHRPAPSDSTDDLALDLESELMGDLGQEQDSASAVEDASNDLSPDEWHASITPSSAAEPDFERSLDALLDEAFVEDQPEGVTEAFAEEPVVEEPETLPEEPAAFLEEGVQQPDDFASGQEEVDHNELGLLDEELAALDEDFAAEEIASVNAAAEEPQAHVPEFFESGHEPAASADDDVPFDYARAAVERPDFLASSSEDEPADDSVDLHETSMWGSAQSWSYTQQAEEYQEAETEEYREPEPQVTETPDRADQAFAWSGGQAADAEAEPAADAIAPASYSDDLPPEIDTVEVPEAAVALAEQFDIPEVPYKEEAKPASELDEIEEILAGAFGETAEQGEQQGDTWAETSPAREDGEAGRSSVEDDFLMAGIGAATTAAAFAGQPAAHTQADDWTNRYDDPAQFAPVPGVQPPAASRGSRLNSRLMMASAVIGGVAILGGVAFFALSSGESGEPVLLSADASPVKMRPENPGGIQIPNQENPVYKRVSGEQTDPAAEQPRLVSSTEEPVVLPLPDEGELGPEEDVAGGTLPQEDVSSAPVEEASASSTGSSTPADTSLAALSGQDRADESTDTAGESTDTSGEPTGTAGEPTGTVGERLTSSLRQEQLDDSVVTVTPHRVRSLVVRPDGTMVPREVPQPVRAEPGAAEIRGESVPGGNTGEDAAQAQQDAQDTAAPAVPRTGPIPPSRPGNIARQPARQEPASAQQPQQVAALGTQQPAQAATAPASEWSVQIASQPSVEDAQKSYQQLAQRYGNVLQGKGVNIVKADIEGKGTYYRVRIPSASKEAAIQLCTQLKSAGGNCFVSK